MRPSAGRLCGVGRPLVQRDKEDGSGWNFALPKRMQAAGGPRRLDRTLQVTRLSNLVRPLLRKLFQIPENIENTGHPPMLRKCCHRLTYLVLRVGLLESAAGFSP